MRRWSANSGRSILTVLAILVSLTLPSLAWSYDSYLSRQEIRDAYFLGARMGRLTRQILPRYSHQISELHQGNCTSEIRLETPFLQVGDYASKVQLRLAGGGERLLRQAHAEPAHELSNLASNGARTNGI